MSVMLRAARASPSALVAVTVGVVLAALGCVGEGFSEPLLSVSS